MTTVYLEMIYFEWDFFQQNTFEFRSSAAVKYQKKTFRKRMIEKRA
jgi:hypothetical protein